jgi:hypothetical protein
MIIHGYPKMKSLKHSSEQMNQALGISIKATFIAEPYWNSLEDSY